MKTTASLLRVSRAAFLAASLVCVPAALAQPESGPESENVGHTRHHHPRNPKHPTTQDAARFITNRDVKRILPLPEEKDAFTFVVFGDRTGGPDDGVAVLADAVRDTNLIEPDLVLTVGDLIQGYNQTEPWLVQMREYKAVMDNLLCPWFPVAGNHDVYYRGPEEFKPQGEHEDKYEMHFGPLWYAFEHKNSWFVVLYSDEGNPETGEKSISKPETQVMSEAQLSWLKDTLSKTKDADHVFVFLHHPRWLKGNYGHDWDKVHEALVAAGNVTAVFAGHIHRMRYDPKDGIEYVTLATTGGHQNETVPQAGWLHHFHIITVRKDQVAMASVPVGEVMDVREIDGQLVQECEQLAKAAPRFAETIVLEPSGRASSQFEVTLSNPTSRVIDVTLTPDSRDARWVFRPDHDHGEIKAGESKTFTFRVERPEASLDAYIDAPTLIVDTQYLAPTFRYTIPTRTVDLPLRLPAPTIAANAPERALDLRADAAIAVPSARIPIEDGPFTIECWFNGEEFEGRTGLLCKTESSDYGIFVSNGKPHFSVHLGGAYVSAAAAESMLQSNRWHHIAGVYDGQKVLLYVDGNLVGETAGSGSRRRNNHPFMIGADVTGQGTPTSFFTGQIDAVRISRTARYSGPSFKPERRFAPDDKTILLYNMDGLIGPWIYDESPAAVHSTRTGEMQIVPVN